MTVHIRKGSAQGSVSAPPSKSFAHRALICAALAEGTSTLRGVGASEDVLATLDCVRALGAEVRQNGDTVTINGNAGVVSDRFPCRESGSTLRFFLPLCLLRNTPCVLSGSPRLMERPQDVYETICREQGLKFAHRVCEIEVCGPLRAGNFRVRGDLSSQFLSGLLFALPLLDGDSRIEIQPPFVSRPYLDITVDVLARFGVQIGNPDPLTLTVPGGQTCQPVDLTVEGDWSNAAFLEAFNLLGGRVNVENLNPQAKQGDRVYRQFFPQLAAGHPTLDLSDCPDLAPVLMALGAALHGVTLTGTARLRIKESDRGAAMAEELAKFGITTDLADDALTVHPGALLKPTVPLNGHNDHRVVMACAALLTQTGGELAGAEAVRKSYPQYFETLRKLGIEVESDAVDNR